MERGIEVQAVTCSVDSCRLEIRPPAPVVGRGQPIAETRHGLYERFGGEVYRDIASELGVSGNALMPAIEVKR